MTRRYFVPNLPADSGMIALPDEEAVHAARVMRVKTGDPVVLFDGEGQQAEGTIASVERRQVYVQVEPKAGVCREPGMVIEVAVSLPKGERAKLLIEKLTELGAARVVPLICQRTQASSKAKPSSATGVNDKWMRYVIEACKQCERNQLMEIVAPQLLDDYLKKVDSELRIFAHPQGESLGGLLVARHPASTAICVGPEGGFTEEEVQRAVSAGWHAVSLGARILRVETAATALVSRLVID